MQFHVTNQNKMSYAIAVRSTRISGSFGTPAVLVKCDRTCSEDNERGRKLAEKIASFLNSLSEPEQEVLLADEMIPMNAKVES